MTSISFSVPDWLLYVAGLALLFHAANEGLGIVIHVLNERIRRLQLKQADEMREAAMTAIREGRASIITPNAMVMQGDSPEETLPGVKAPVKH